LIFRIPKVANSPVSLTNVEFKLLNTKSKYTCKRFPVPKRTIPVPNRLEFQCLSPIWAERVSPISPVSPIPVEFQSNSSRIPARFQPDSSRIPARFQPDSSGVELKFQPAPASRAARVAPPAHAPAVSSPPSSAGYFSPQNPEGKLSKRKERVGEREKNLGGGRWCRGCRVDGKFGLQGVGLRGGVVGIDLHAACNSNTITVLPSPYVCTLSAPSPPLPDFFSPSPTLFFLLDSFPSGFCKKK